MRQLVKGNEDSKNEVAVRLVFTRQTGQEKFWGWSLKKKRKRKKMQYLKESDVLQKPSVCYKGLTAEASRRSNIGL